MIVETKLKEPRKITRLLLGTMWIVDLISLTVRINFKKISSNQAAVKSNEHFILLEALISIKIFDIRVALFGCENIGEVFKKSGTSPIIISNGIKIFLVIHR